MTRAPGVDVPPIPANPLSNDLAENHAAVKGAIGQGFDLIERELRVGPEGPAALMLGFHSLVDPALISNGILKPLAGFDAGQSLNRKPEHLLELLRTRCLAGAGVLEVGDLRTLLHRLAVGDCLLLVDGVATALAVNVADPPSRRIEEAPSESVVRGPRDSFVEAIEKNVSLIRLRVKHPNLRLDGMVIGKLTLTDVVMAYVRGVAREGLVAEARRRLRNIEIDGVLESGTIEVLIEDEPRSPFPQLMRTERPDRAAAALLEGRVVIVVDGTPFVLIAPATLSMFLTAAEDYYERPFIGTFLRLLRYFAFTLSLVLPSLYVALTTFHQEMLPTSLVLSIAAQRRGVPFPAVVEALMLEFAFEILREAGLRLPRLVGPGVTIAGTLVVGDAAVRAGLVSPFMVVVVGLTAISSFTVPIFSLGATIRLARFPMVLLAASSGLFGVVAGLSLLLIHLCTLRSFGVPYLEPFAPLVAASLADSVVVAPVWMQDTRPPMVGRPGKRVGRGSRPGTRPRKPRQGTRP